MSSVLSSQSSILSPQSSGPNSWPSVLSPQSENTAFCKTAKTAFFASRNLIQGIFIADVAKISRYAFWRGFPVTCTSLNKYKTVSCLKHLHTGEFWQTSFMILRPLWSYLPRLPPDLSSLRCTAASFILTVTKREIGFPSKRQTENGVIVGNGFREVCVLQNGWIFRQVSMGEFTAFPIPALLRHLLEYAILPLPRRKNPDPVVNLTD